MFPNRSTMREKWKQLIFFGEYNETFYAFANKYCASINDKQLNLAIFDTYESEKNNKRRRHFAVANSDCFSRLDFNKFIVIIHIFFQRTAMPGRSRRMMDLFTGKAPGMAFDRFENYQLFRTGKKTIADDLFCRLTSVTPSACFSCALAR